MRYDEPKPKDSLFHRKSNNEVAIGIRPDQLLVYAATAEAFHSRGLVKTWRLSSSRHRDDGSAVVFAWLNRLAPNPRAGLWLGLDVRRMKHISDSLRYCPKYV